MVYIAHFTELNLQICDYAKKQRICCENCKYALDENFHGHFCPRRKAAKFCHPGWKYLLNAIANTWSPWRSCSWGGWGRWQATCKWTPVVSSWCRTWKIGLSHFGRKQVAPDVGGVHPQIGDVVGDDLLKQGRVAHGGDVPHLSHCDHLKEPGQKSKPQRIIHRLFQF